MHALFIGLAGSPGFEGGQFRADIHRASSQAEEARTQTALLRMDVERLRLITKCERGISRIHPVRLYCGTPVRHGWFKR